MPSSRSSRVRVVPLPAALPQLQSPGGSLDPKDCPETPDQVAGKKAHGHGRGAAFWIIAAAALACLVVLAIVLAVALHRSSSSIGLDVNATSTTAPMHNASVNITAFTGVSGARSGVDYNQAFRDGTYVDAANPKAAEIQAVVDAANRKGGQTNKTGV